MVLDRVLTAMSVCAANYVFEDLIVLLGVIEAYLTVRPGRT